MTTDRRVGPARLAVILRGIPGSGKSHLARTLAAQAGLAERACIFGTDALFDEFHQGRFDPALLPRLHQQNLVRFIEAAARGTALIVCDNTNIEPWEFAAYTAVARALGYQVDVRVVGSPWLPEEVQRCAERNLHEVPLERVQVMARRLCATLSVEVRGEIMQ